MQFFRRRSAGEKIPERPANADNLIRRLMDKLHPEMPDSRREPLGQMQAGFLRFRSKYCVAAADIRHHWMRATGGIPQRNLVFLARPAAIAIACAS